MTLDAASRYVAFTYADPVCECTITATPGPTRAR